MANEIPWVATTGLTLYAQIFNTTGQFWNTGTLAFEAYQTANIANYAVALTEQGTASGVYFGSFPAAITAGDYTYIVRSRLGGAPAETDVALGTGDLGWSGTAVFPQVQLASGQVVTTASGAFVWASLNSGQFVLPYSGQMSGQPMTLLSGLSYTASGINTVSPVVSGTVYLASGPVNAFLIGVGSGAIGSGSLSSGELANIALSHLTMANGIESGITPQQLGRVTFAAVAGQSSGFTTSGGQIVYRNFLNTLDRITANVDNIGNRSGIVLDLN